MQYTNDDATPGTPAALRIAARSGAGLLVALSVVALLRPSPAMDASPLVDLGTAGRAAAYLALVLLIGAWSVVRLLLPRLPAVAASDAAPLAGSVWPLGRPMLPVLVAASVARGVAQIAAFRDPAEPITGAWLSTLVASTSWGRVWVLQAGAAVLLWLVWPARGDGRRRSLVVAGCLLLAVLAEAAAGHGLAGRWAGGIGVGLHAVHLMGAGIWLGALTITALLLPRGTTIASALLPPLYAAIAPLALTGASGVVGAGALMGVEYAGGLGALWPPADAYTRALLLKTTVAAGVLLLGAWHWRIAVPQLASRGDAAFRRTLRAELLLTVLVLALSSVLVALPAAGV